MARVPGRFTALAGGLAILVGVAYWHAEASRADGCATAKKELAAQAGDSARQSALKAELQGCVLENHVSVAELFELGIYR